MSLARAKFIADKLNNSFWKCKYDKSDLVLSLCSLNIMNRVPIEDTDYPYMFEITHYSPNMSWDSKVSKEIGYISVFGDIVFPNATTRLDYIGCISISSNDGNFCLERIDSLPDHYIRKVNDKNIRLSLQLQNYY